MPVVFTTHKDTAHTTSDISTGLRGIIFSEPLLRNQGVRFDRMLDMRMLDMCTHSITRRYANVRYVHILLHVPPRCIQTSTKHKDSAHVHADSKPMCSWWLNTHCNTRHALRGSCALRKPMCSWCSSWLMHVLCCSVCCSVCLVSVGG